MSTRVPDKQSGTSGALLKGTLRVRRGEILRNDPNRGQREFRKRLASEIDKRGTVDVLRHGIKGWGLKFDLCYLWEQVWHRDSFLDLLGRFVHTEIDESGKATGKVIFPRFHQWDCVLSRAALRRVRGSRTPSPGWPIDCRSSTTTTTRRCSTRSSSSRIAESSTTNSPRRSPS